ncbi:hypothetical protein CM19_06740 [Candidatus Acidianus copahuensis]|uniref:Uncharacterized protein n=1 Tax=Candidatus Acidianus copahuensis TaxID=1160895 RepID=A0A031LRR5_9CREN|nr:hypothetical protein [Candidatus Acidianus copahuensis]EZQ07114.1 hypothetical protein CM19_06740 [Candidatus Acidianus copahuensis]
MKIEVDGTSIDISVPGLIHEKVTQVYNALRFIDPSWSSKREVEQDIGIRVRYIDKIADTTQELLSLLLGDSRKFSEEITLKLLDILDINTIKINNVKYPREIRKEFDGELIVYPEIISLSLKGFREIIDYKVKVKDYEVQLQLAVSILGTPSRFTVKDKVFLEFLKDRIYALSFMKIFEKIIDKIGKTYAEQLRQLGLTTVELKDNNVILR